MEKDKKLGEWVPVEEQLPEKNGRYLCTYVFGSSRYEPVFVQVLYYYATDAVPHFQYELSENGPKVIAWMPLPKPYRPGDQDDEGE